MIWPPEYLFEALYNARHCGVRFAAAWPDAAAEAARISDAPAEWFEVFEATRGAWERGFARSAPTRRESALEAAGAELELEADRSRRRCAHCAKWIPVDRDPRAEYCTDGCRRRANYLIEREREGRTAAQPRRAEGGADLDFDVGRSLILTLSKSLSPRQRQPN